MQIDPSQQNEIYSISQLNRAVYKVLATSFEMVLVEGEISNLRAPSSGHLYFTMKDETAQVRCALFRQRAMHLKTQLEDGMHVMARARVSIYEPRGDYQLIVDYIEETGDGRLRRAYEALKKQLAAEGLFEDKYKKPIPLLPRRIGVITSPSGAAIQDILSILQRRFAAIPIIIYPAQVQGEAAAQSIVKAIEIANKRAECDCLIVARGGGSLEDLWPFNEEIVARAIFASELPIISGVGHEIDVTIADYVADYRAPTPSAAAEKASPDAKEWQKNLARYYTRFSQLMRASLKHLALILKASQHQLQHPGRKLQQQTQQVDYLEQSLQRLMRYCLQNQSAIMQRAIAALQQQAPARRIERSANQLEALQHRLQQTQQGKLQFYQQRLANLARALDTVSPLNTLERGYSIVQINAEVVRSVKQIKVEDKVVATLADGQMECIVTGLLSGSR